jgi:hypothetical protein
MAMAKYKGLTTEKCLNDLKDAYKAKSKLIERQHNDFLFSFGKQWTDEEVSQLEKAKIKPIVDNRIAPNIYLLTGLERQNRSDFKAFPEGEEDGLKAEIASALFKKSIFISKYADKSSEQFKDGITCGEAHLELYLDDSDNIINSRPCWKKLDSEQVIADPSSREYDYSDARYVYKITYGMNKEDLKSIYPEKGKAIDLIANGKLNLDTTYDGEKHVQPRDYPTKSEDSGLEDDNKDEVDLIERYYKKQVKHFFICDKKTGVIKQARDEEAAKAFIDDYKATLSQNDIMYQQALSQAEIAAMQGQQVQPPQPPPEGDPERYFVKSKMTPEIWVYAHVPGMEDALADEVAWFFPKWKTFPFVPYYARFSSAPIKGDDRHYLVQGLVSAAKDAQERHNKALVLTHRHLNSSANSGWLAPENSWVNPDEVRNFGSTPGVNLEYKPQIGKPERITPAPLSNAHASMAEQAIDAIRGSLGINSDLLAAQQGGTDSGRAIALRQKQGLLMVQEVFDNLSRSRVLAGRFILSQLGRIFDTETAKKILGEAFLKKNFPPLLMMNPETHQQEPMIGEDGQPMEYDKEMAELAIAEVLSGDLGMYDVTVGEAVSSETLRMANAIELKEIAQAFPGVIPPELLIEESQLPQSTKTKISEAIKNARMAQQQQQQQRAVPVAVPQGDLQNG